jgi:glycosyltransferase involved in cell wall biosynthesis
MTLISVVTAVRNRRAIVAQALDSVLSQSHPEIDPIVVDGASTDGTTEVLESYRNRLSVLVSEPDTGIYDALNKGLRLARGDVVGFLHADDLMAHGDVLSRIGAAFEDPRVDAVYGDLVYVRQDDTSKIVRYWKAGNYQAGALSRGWMPPHPTFYARREAYQRLGSFDTRYRIAADYDLMLRFLSADGFRVRYIPDVLVRMRTGGISNGSLRSIVRKSREDYLIARRNGVGGLLTIARKNVSKVRQFLHEDATVD